MSNLVVKRLRNKEDKLLALRLVGRQYLESGYYTEEEAQQPEQTKIGQLVMRLETATFGVYQAEFLLGTISVVPSTVGSLPMSEQFETEMSPFLESGYLYAEVCQLAIDKALLPKAGLKSFGLMQEIMRRLMRAAIDYAWYRNIDSLFFTVNPKHALFYSALGAKKLSEEKYYDSVRAPGVAYVVKMSDLQSVIEKKPSLNLILESLKSIMTPDSELVD